MRKTYTVPATSIITVAEQQVLLEGSTNEVFSKRQTFIETDDEENDDDIIPHSHSPWDK